MIMIYTIKMSLTNIRTELAAPGRETTDQANVILRVLRDPLDTGYPFNVTSNPAIVSVGYISGQAVTTAVYYEEIAAARPSDDEAKSTFTALPFLGVYLIATESDFRRRGYGKQLVQAIVGLAAHHNFDHVEAIQPGSDGAMPFWLGCGFKPLPYKNFGRHDFYRRIGEAGIGDGGVDMIVSDEANQRLADFIRT